MAVGYWLSGWSYLNAHVAGKHSYSWWDKKLQPWVVTWQHPVNLCVHTGSEHLNQLAHIRDFIHTELYRNCQDTCNPGTGEAGRTATSCVPPSSLMSTVTSCPSQRNRYLLWSWWGISHSREPWGEETHVIIPYVANVTYMTLRSLASQIRKFWVCLL